MVFRLLVLLRFKFFSRKLFMMSGACLAGLIWQRPLGVFRQVRLLTSGLVVALLGQAQAQVLPSAAPSGNVTISANPANPAGVSPSTPVTGTTLKLIVPYTPGTGMDLIARAVSPELARLTGQSVVVENHAGASGNIGAMMVAKATPDGLTLMVNAKTFALTPMLYKSVNYNTLLDFTPITLAAYGTSILVTHPKSGFSDFHGFIEVAKAHPGVLTYSSAGLGTSQHISMELVKDMAHIDLLHVPYKGSAGALSDLLGGQVSVSFVPVHVAMTHVLSGRLVALAVASPKRHPKAPTVPTFKEVGLEGAEADIWYGFWGPKGLPPSMVKSLNSALKSILLSPQVNESLEKQGLDVNTSTPEELQAIVTKEIQISGALIRKKKLGVD